jgi:hypothetical protein
MTPLSAREVRRMQAANAAPATIVSPALPTGNFIARRPNKSNAAA